LPTTASCAVAVELATAATRLTHREIWRLPFRRLPFGAGQRGTNQPAVYWALVLGLVLWRIIV
jgi:hypothetical protein